MRPTVARGPVVSCTAVSPLLAEAGGLFSAALSLRSPWADVIRHRALRSPEVPQLAPRPSRGLWRVPYGRVQTEKPSTADRSCRPILPTDPGNRSWQPTPAESFSIIANLRQNISDPAPTAPERRPNTDRMPTIERPEATPETDRKVTSVKFGLSWGLQVGKEADRECPKRPSGRTLQKEVHHGNRRYWSSHSGEAEVP